VKERALSGAYGRIPYSPEQRVYYERTGNKLARSGSDDGARGSRDGGAERRRRKFFSKCPCDVAHERVLAEERGCGNGTVRRGALSCRTRRRSGQPPDFPFLQMILFRGAVAERPAGRNASGLPPAGLAHVPCDGLVKLGLPTSCNASNMSNHRLSRDQQ
jgi:hypothetical protein